MTSRPAPWMGLAERELDTREGDGSKNNPAVLKYYAAAGFSGVTEDEVPWCAAFVGWALKSAGYKPSGSLLARSYLEFGEHLQAPDPGCIVVFKRGNDGYSGHVAFFVRYSPDGNGVVVLGGNQSDSVRFSTYPASKVLGYRWPTERLPGLEEVNPTPVVEPPTSTEVEKDLRDKGSRIVTGADNVERGAKTTIFGGGLLLIAKTVIDVLGSPQFQQAMDTVLRYAWFLVPAGAALIWYEAVKIRSARVDDAMTGRHLGSWLRF